MRLLVDPYGVVEHLCASDPPTVLTFRVEVLVPEFLVLVTNSPSTKAALG